MESKILVAYFSRSGNSRAAARTVAELTGGELYEIKRAQPYNPEYRACIKEAVAEKAANARPELADPLPAVENFGTLVLVYPNWCGTCPMPVLSFLQAGGFAGRAVLPLCTNGGSGLAQGPADIAAACPAARVLPGLSVNGAAVAGAQDDIRHWLEEQKIL